MNLIIPKSQGSRQRPLSHSEGLFEGVFTGKDGTIGAAWKKQQKTTAMHRRILNA